MKTSADKINEALRKGLQRALANYEVTPGPSVDQRIYRALHSRQVARPNRHRWLKVSALAALLLSLGLFVYVRTTQPTDVSKKMTRSGNRSNPLAESPGQSRLRHGSPPAIADRGAPGRGAPRTFSAPNVSPIVHSNAEMHSVKTRPLPKTDENLIHLRTNPTSKRTSRPNPTNKNLFAERAGKAAGLSGRVALSVKPTDFRPSTQSARDDQPAIENNPSSPESGQPAADFSVGRLASPFIKSLPPIRPFAELAGQSSLRLPTPAGVALAGSAHRRRPRFDRVESNHAWLITLVPLTTRQRIFILPQTHSRVQSVAFPDGVAPLAGFKASLGMDHKGTQIMVNFSRLHLQSYYQYSTDQYAVIENGSNQYAIQRLGDADTTNLSLNLLGLGVRKQIQFGGGILGRLFATAGLEYTRSLRARRQDLLFVNFTGGKKVAVSPQLSLTVGPYVEYSFTRLRVAEQLKSRPYQIGLSVGLQLNRPAH